MVYQKEEFEIEGVEVTIQQVRGPDSDMGASEPSAWIDGYSAYATDALEELPIDVSNRSPYEQVKAAVAYMVDNGVQFCPKCESFRDSEGFVSTGFAGCKCGVCAEEDTTCEDGGEHEDECLNPRQKHNARVATKYKCVKCGRKRKTTPTG